MKATIKRTERGWAGHFICAKDCLFRRNTLLEYSDIKIVVSTVGLWKSSLRGEEFETLSGERYFETMAFHTDKEDTRYNDTDVDRPVSFGSEWTINEIDADDKANDMHESVVIEISQGLISGNKYEGE